MIYARIIRAVIACATAALLAGCLAPPKRHAWQISKEELTQIRDVESWPQLSTNNYARVPDSRTEDAVALLQNQAFLPLNASQLSAFAPSLSGHPGTKPYLVRGVSYSSRPVYTIVRFESSTGTLFVQQATYNGEMVMPFRWMAEPNALVVLLSRAPEQIYSHPLLGGDWIFYGKQDSDSR